MFKTVELLLDASCNVGMRVSMQGDPPRGDGIDDLVTLFCEEAGAPSFYNVAGIFGCEGLREGVPDGSLVAACERSIFL